MILDCEVLLIDNKTSKPLPFTSLGIHKRQGWFTIFALSPDALQLSAMHSPVSLCLIFSSSTAPI
jgi:hypothetical protein